jgi:hypothetical protein
MNFATPLSLQVLLMRAPEMGAFSDVSALDEQIVLIFGKASALAKLPH